MAEKTGDSEVKPDVKEEKVEEQPQELTDKERLDQSVEKFSAINNESFQSELLSLAETIKDKFKLEHDKTSLEAFMAGAKSVVIKVLGTKAGHLEIPKAVSESKIGKWLGLASKDITYGDLTTALVGAVIAGASSAGVKTAFYSLTGVGGVAAAAVAGGVIGGTRSALTEGHMYAKEARSAENWREQIGQMNDPASKLRAIELLIKDKEFKKHLKANSSEMIDLVTMYGEIAAETEEAGLLELAMKTKGFGRGMDGVDRYIGRVDQETRKRMFKAFGQGAVRGMIFSTIGYGAAKGLEWVFDKVGTAFMSGAHAQGSSEVPGAQGHVWHTGTGEHVGEGHLNIDEQGRLNGYSIVTVDDKGLVNGDIAGATAHDVAKQVSNALVQDKLMDAAHQVTFQDKLAALITKDHAGGQFAGGETIRISANDLNQALGEAGTSINKSALEALQPIGAAAAATGAEAATPGAPAGSPAPHLAAAESGTTPAAPHVAPATPGAPVGPNTIAMPDQTAPAGTTAPHLAAAEQQGPSAPVAPATPAAPGAPLHQPNVIERGEHWLKQQGERIHQTQIQNDQINDQHREKFEQFFRQTGNILEQNQQGIEIGAGVVAVGALITAGALKIRKRNKEQAYEREQAEVQEKISKLLTEEYKVTDPEQIVKDLEFLSSRDEWENDEEKVKGDEAFKTVLGQLAVNLPYVSPTEEFQNWLKNDTNHNDTSWRVNPEIVYSKGKKWLGVVGDQGAKITIRPSAFWENFSISESTPMPKEPQYADDWAKPARVEPLNPELNLGAALKLINTDRINNHQPAAVEINRLSDQLYGGLRVGLTIDGQPGTLVRIERVNLKLKATEPLKTFEFVVETGGDTRRLAVEEFFAQTSDWTGGGEISAPATENPETATEAAEYTPADNNADTIRQDLLARGEGKRQDIIDYLAKRLATGQAVIVTDAASGLTFWTLTQVVDDGNAMISFRGAEPRQENLGMVASPTSIWEFSQPEPEIEPIVTDEQRATEARGGIVGSLDAEIARRQALEEAGEPAAPTAEPANEYTIEGKDAKTALTELSNAFHSGNRELTQTILSQLDDKLKTNKILIDTEDGPATLSWIQFSSSSWTGGGREGKSVDIKYFKINNGTEDIELSREDFFGKTKNWRFEDAEKPAEQTEAIQKALEESENSEDEATIETRPTSEVLDEIEAMTAQNDLAGARALLESSGLAAQPIIFPPESHESMDKFFTRESQIFDLNKPFNLEVSNGKIQFYQEKSASRFTLTRKRLDMLLPQTLEISKIAAAAAAVEEPAGEPAPAEADTEAPAKAVEYEIGGTSAEQVLTDLNNAASSGNEKMATAIAVALNEESKAGRIIKFEYKNPVSEDSGSRNISEVVTFEDEVWVRTSRSLGNSSLQIADFLEITKNWRFEQPASNKESKSTEEGPAEGAAEYNIEGKTAEQVLTDLRDSTNPDDQKLSAPIINALQAKIDSGSTIKFDYPADWTAYGKTGVVTGTEMYGNYPFLLLNQERHYTPGEILQTFSNLKFEEATSDEERRPAEEPTAGAADAKLPEAPELKSVPKMEVIAQIQRLIATGAREETAKFLDSSGLTTQDIVIPEQIIPIFHKHTDERPNNIDFAKPFRATLDEAGTKFLLTQEGANYPFLIGPEVLAAVLPEMIKPSGLVGQASTEAKPTGGVMNNVELPAEKTETTMTPASALETLGKFGTSDADTNTASNIIRQMLANGINFTLNEEGLRSFQEHQEEEDLDIEPDIDKPVRIELTQKINDRGRLYRVTQENWKGGKTTAWIEAEAVANGLVPTSEEPFELKKPNKE